MMIPVIISFFLEPNIVGSYFPMSFWTSPLGILTAVVFIALRVLFFSGVYASMVEIASGEKDLLAVEDVWTNSRSYWWIYGALAMFPIAVHFLIFAVRRQMDIPIALVGSLFDPIVLYIFAQAVITKKYLRPMKISQQPERIRAEALFLICAAVLASALLAVASNLVPALTEGPERLRMIIYNALFFGIKYLHFFLFLSLCLILLNRYPKIKKQLLSKKEIVLVTPPAGGLLFSISSLLSRPPTPVFILLKALTPKRFKVKIYDQVIWHDRYYGPDKLVGITSCTSNAAESYRIAKQFRARGSKVIMGGAHAMFLVEEALKFCDSVIIGDAEPVWKQVLEDFENGRLQKIYIGEQNENYHHFSHQELLKLDPKLIAHFVETGRGCKFYCDFCAVPAICSRRPRHKPLAEVIELLERIKGHVPTVSFIDNNIYAEPNYAKELFRQMKPLNIKWTCSCSIDIARDEEALRLAKESGCVLMIIGYEISNESAEKEKGGKYSMADQYLTLTRKIKEAGISVKGQFIFGFDGDTFQSLAQLWAFCFRLFPTFTILAFLTPFPGSKFFKDMLRNGRMLNLNWSRYTLANLVFQPRNISPGMYNTLFPFIFAAFLAASSHGMAFLLLLIFGKAIIEDGGRRLLSLARP